MDAGTIGLSLDDLKDHAQAIGIAADPAKHAAVLSALCAGLLSTRITDEATSRHVLEHAP